MAIGPYHPEREGAPTSYELEHQQEAALANQAVQAFDERTNLMEAYARTHGLRGNSLSMLMWLYYSPTPITQRDITRRTHSTKQTVNMTVTGWRKRGLVETVPTDMSDTGDRRERQLRLTDAGLAWAGAILDPVRNAEIRAMNALRSSERDTFIRLQTAYVEALGRELEQEHQS